MLTWTRQGGLHSQDAVDLRLELKRRGDFAGQSGKEEAHRL